jgi:hypothetical protein
MAPGRTAIASRTLLAIDEKGREFEITITVGEPQEISETEWACPVSVGASPTCVASTLGRRCSWRIRWSARCWSASSKTAANSSPSKSASRQRRKSYSQFVGRIAIRRYEFQDAGLRLLRPALGPNAKTDVVQ